MTAAEILEKLEEEGKKYRAGTKKLLVWYIISGRIFELTCNYKPVIAKKHSSVE